MDDDHIDKAVAYFREHPEIADEINQRLGEMMAKASTAEIKELGNYLDRPDVRALRLAMEQKMGHEATERAAECLNAAILGVKGPDDIPPHHYSTRQMMQDTAQSLANVDPTRSLRHDSTDADFVRVLSAYAAKQDIKVRAALGIEKVRIQIAFGLMWALNAWPVFRVGHKTAAAMMATPVDEEVVEHIRLPYRAMVITIPQGMLETENPTTGKIEPLVDVQIMMFHSPHGPMLWRSANSEMGCALNGYALPQKYFAGDVKKTDRPDIWDHPMTQMDERTNLLVSRYIAGVCLAASSPDNLIFRVGKSGGGKGYHHGQPEMTVFEVRSPVAVDCREAVTQYARVGKRGPLTVISLTRGHYRRQHYGASGTEVKIIWVHPYWRGPERANVALRQYKIE